MVASRILGHGGKLRRALALAAVSGCACAANDSLKDELAPTPAHVASAGSGESLRAKLESEGFRVGEGREGHFVLAWRALGGQVPRNREFDMDVIVLREGAIVEGAQVRVRGWMPDHGHGLARRPRVRELEPRRLRVDSMILHMRGFWQIFFDIAHDGVGDIVEFEQRL